MNEISEVFNRDMLKTIYQIKRECIKEIIKLRVELYSLGITGKLSNPKRFIQILNRLNKIDPVEKRYNLEKFDYDDADYEEINTIDISEESIKYEPPADVEAELKKFAEHLKIRYKLDNYYIRKPHKIKI